MTRGNARADFRVNAALPVTVGAGGIPGLTVNISASGMLIVSDEPLDVGTITEFRLQLPSGGKVTGLCRVVRRPTARQAAVTFCKVDEGSRAHIRAFLLGYQAEQRRAVREAAAAYPA